MIDDNDNATFTRLYYCGTVQMGMAPETFWLMPIGLFLDIWACHMQFIGRAKAKSAVTIDDVLPLNIN